MSISTAYQKAEEFAEVEDKVSNKLRDKLPAFLEKYREFLNFVTDKENAEETIGNFRRQIRRLQDEAEEIKSLNQLLLPETFKRRKLNRHLLYYAQNRGTLPEDKWDEI